jgi:hypothetical protein
VVIKQCVYALFFGVCCFSIFGCKNMSGWLLVNCGKIFEGFYDEYEMSG